MGAPRAPPPLLHPGTSAQSCSLTSQAHYSSSTSPASSPPYVLHVACLPSSQGYIFAGSDDIIRQFDSSLKPVGDSLKSSQNGLTSLKSGSGVGSTAVFTTANDGTVVGRDTRDLRNEAFKLKCNSGAPYLTCSQNADLTCLAVGSAQHHYEAVIDLWDLRNMSLDNTYSEAHSDDITALSFHPSTSHVLLSGSIDGLLNTYDIRMADEDDAVLTTAQVGTSVLDADWMALSGNDIDSTSPYNGAWVSTTIETVQLWDIENSKLIKDLGDIRDVCLEPWRSDFLIAAHYNPTLGGVCLMTGTQRGDIGIISLKDRENWILEQVLPSAGGRTLSTSSGHTDIVRCAYMDTKSSTIVSGGEDGQICLWTL